VLGEAEAIDLAELVESVVETTRPVAAQREARLELQAEGALKVRGDRFLLTQAVGNLLDNALDFSPQAGRILVAVHPLEDQTEIEIRDQGPGIQDYALERVFERFFSLPRPDGGRKGTGLGLSFVREVAHLHGGSVHLENLPPRQSRGRPYPAQAAAESVACTRSPQLGRWRGTLGSSDLALRFSGCSDASTRR